MIREPPGAPGQAAPWLPSQAEFSPAQPAGSARRLTARTGLGGRLSAVTPLDRHARIDQTENPDSIEAILAAEPIENADPTEPAEPIDKTEPAEPIDRIEPAEPIDKIEPLDPMLQSEPAEPAERTDRRLFRMTAFSRRRGRQRSAGWL